MRSIRKQKTTRALVFGALVLLYIGFTACGERGSEGAAVVISSRVDSLEAAILEAPNAPEPYHARAQYNSSQGDPQSAFEDWGLALKADSAFAPAWENRIDLLYRMQNMEACLEELNACIRFAPQSVPCLIRRAEFNIHLNQAERAFNDLNQALQINDQLHEAYWMKGKIYAANGDTEKAISSFQTAIEVNPTFFDGFISLGLFLAERGDPIAEEFYRSAIELRPQSLEAQYNFAMFLQQEQRLDEAIGSYREILALDSTNATACFNQGYIHLEYFAQYDSARFWFTEAIKRLPYYHQAFFNRGLARESLGDLAGSISDYSEALRIKPDYTVAALAKDRVLKAN
ncbi:MAG: hypothetical protein CMD33_09955 [Flavobacteriales bacterium]|nr:hypothetical protein [Flavobacteriales bacterium]